MDLRAQLESLQGLAAAGVRAAEVDRTLSDLLAQLQTAAAEHCHEAVWSARAQALLRGVERTAVRLRLEQAGFATRPAQDGSVVVSVPMTGQAATEDDRVRLRSLIAARDDRDAEQPDPVTSEFIIQTGG